MFRGERMFVFIKQDFFHPDISMDFPGCSFACTLWTPVTRQQLHNKAPRKEFGLTVQPEPGTTHTSPVVQRRILSVPAPLEMLLKELADVELVFKLMPNISLNEYTIKIKFLVSGRDVRGVLQQLQH